MEGSPGVDSIYLDFSKAFDKVDHGVLLQKLKNFGICGKVGTWLAMFLRNRYQMVVIEGTKSVKEAVVSGVPQGTVLGPVLFLVLISDIANGVDILTRVTSFADDTRASRSIRSSQDYEQLQSDLNKIYEWADNVNMEFNGDKFELFRCWPDVNNWTQHLPFQLKDEHSYVDCKTEHIEEKVHVKDLGVMLSSDLTFSFHITKLVKTCRKQAGYILRTFRS